VRSDRERLLDIQEAIERIERYTVQGRSAFDRDERISLKAFVDTTLRTGNI
jgi:uncharacterized protein with HEPN domain